MWIYLIGGDGMGLSSKDIKELERKASYLLEGYGLSSVVVPAVHLACF